MRRSSVTVLLLLALGLATAAESSRSLFNAGRKAESRQDFITAYTAYKQAYEQSPTDLRYRIAYQRTRVLASSAYIHAGQQLRDQGKMAEALSDFQAAAQADPTNDAAFQELRKTQSMIEKGSADVPRVTPPDPNSSQLSRRLKEAAGPVDLAPVSNQPITLKISNDSKVIFETIGKLAGINVLFDPDYTSRRIPLELNGVTLEEALDILAFQSKTFWRPITPNTIFIAADTQQKRKELEQNVLKTFYLSNVTAPTDLQDVQNVIRQILDVQKVIPVPSQNAVIVRGTPDQIALVEKIVDDLDRAKPEVIVEVAVLQVRRDKLRNLGLSPPSSASIALQSPTALTTTTTPTTGGTTGTGTSTTTNNNNSITLNTFNNLSAKDFAVSIPTATANFLYSDADSKLIQNPEIRAADNQKATLKIGDRVPIATGSFGAGFGGIGATNLVNTQFQYIDVGVNIDITPHVHANREVTLKLALDVSQVTGTTTIGGISQPIISQRKVEHEIRLRDGEANLLGGIFEQTEQSSVSGLPYLAQLPFLKYFFSSTNKEKIDNEIVFMIVPHIVRSPEFSDDNIRAIDVGSGQDRPSLRHEPRGGVGPAPAKAASQAPIAVPQPPNGANTPNPAFQGVQGLQPPPAQSSQQQPPPATVGQAPSSPTAPGSFSSAAQPAVLTTTQSATAPVSQHQSNPPGVANPSAGQTPGTTTAGPSAANVPANSGPATLRFDPNNLTPSVGTTFSVNINVVGAQEIASAPVQITFDPKTLQLLNVSSGDLLSRDGQAVALMHREELDTGTIQVNATRPPNTGGISGDGVLYVLTFQAKAVGDSTLNAVRPSFRNSAMQSVAVQPASATVSVR